MSPDKTKSVSILTRNNVLAQVRTYMNVPWRHQGRSMLGIDCAGLVIAVARDLGISQYDIRNYRREPRPHDFIAAFRANMDEKLIGNRMPGDVILMHDRNFTCHAGFFDIVNGVEMVVHAYALRRKVVEEPLHLFGQNINYCFSYKGLET